ncbi:MAG: hypothetical protein RIT23_398, partial [Actinomycetota bacterium]
MLNVDVNQLYRQRQDRLTSMMKSMGVSAVLTPDPINIM